MFWHRAIKSSLGCRIKQLVLTIDTTIPTRFGGPENDLQIDSAMRGSAGNIFRHGLL
jgi:hypothetical protein